MFKFKNEEDYRQQREALMNEALNLRDEGKIDEGMSKLDKVEKMDNAWADHTKALANAAALEDKFTVLDLASKSVYRKGKVIGSMNGSIMQMNGFEDMSKPIFLNKEDKMVDRCQVNAEEMLFNQQGALGNVVRGMVTGKWESSELKNAITTTTTGTLIPEVLSARVIDLARNVSLFTSAGVQVLPMETDNVKISRVKSDPNFKFKEEGKEAMEASFELDDVSLKAKTIYGYAYVTLEAIKSSNNLDAILMNTFSQAIAQGIDTAMLYGQETSDGVKDVFAPAGIMNDASIHTITATPGAGYDDFIKAIGKIRGANGTPTTLGYNSYTEEMFSLLRDSTGVYLEAPKSVSDLQKIVSNQLMHDEELGDDALVFDPRAMVIGMQNNIQIKIIEDTECLKKGLVAFQIYAMVDCVATEPKKICKITGIKGK